MRAKLTAELNESIRTMTAPDSRYLDEAMARLAEAVAQPVGGSIVISTADACAIGNELRRLQALARGPQQAGGEDVLRCLDCGKTYTGFPLDVVLPDNQWQAIAGGPGGVLCAACIVERGSRLPGVTVAKLYFPDLSDPVAALQAEVALARNELSCCDDVPLQDGLAAGIANLREQRDVAEAALREAKEALSLIAAPQRPDGTWNRDRAACQHIAERASAALSGGQDDA